MSELLSRLKTSFGLNLAPPTHDPHLKYRSDIDGLRAISVGAVIIYHLLPRRFPAGGLGVDMFFVISGFLIGKIILDAVRDGTFSFADFYIRRVRRIGPAFLVCILASTLASFWVLYPAELMRFAVSALAAMGGGSNIYFYFTSGYFDTDSTWLPLLHTWTLGVEEQFYFIFPVIVILAVRFVGLRILPWLLLAIGLISLSVSQFQITAAPTAAFYLLPSRGFELMAGVLATFLPPIRNGALRFILVTIGLALIGGSLVLLRPAEAFPGIFAIPPCLGTVLVIISGAQGSTLPHRLLSIWPARITGLASYSLYLWHWPIMVFYRFHNLSERVTIKDCAIILVMVFAAGLFSWGVIERPFRAKGMSGRKVLIWCGGLTALTLTLLSAILIGKGLPQRMPPAALRMVNFEGHSAAFRMPVQRCFLNETDTVATFDQAGCLNSVSGKGNWLLFGDSHAAMLWGALVDRFPATNFQTMTLYGCDVELRAQKTGRFCDDLTDYLVHDYLSGAKIDGVVLTSRWAIFDPTATKAFADRLRARGLKLLLIGPTPEFAISVPRLLAETIRRNDPGLTTKALDPRLIFRDAELAAFAHENGIAYLSAFKAICSDRSGCPLISPQGESYYFDSNHYGKLGADMAVEKMLAADPAEMAVFGTPAAP
jgi:peptidoglycan/LPS O-acetylase OafA/YrhL